MHNRAALQTGSSVRRMGVDALVRSLAVSQDRPLMLFLGAGASMTSGMPSANQCIWEWKRDIFLSNNPGIEEQFSELSLPSVRGRIQTWLDRQRCYPAAGHPDEYGAYIEACFSRSDDRRRYFERWVKQSTPHTGYRLLAELAASGLIQTVWTTNFDGLIARAATATNLTPIEIGVDSQQRLYRAPGKGELACVSMHGDYRYDRLKNSPGELAQVEVQLRDSLIEALGTHTVVVAGYSGRDESVMQAFHHYAASGPARTDLPLFWTQYGEDPPLDTVSAFLSTNDDEPSRFLVPGVSFDDLMRRLTLYLSKGPARDRVNKILDEHATTPVNQLTAFGLPPLPPTGLIKSNAIPLTPPQELLEFDLHQWPASGTVWATLRELGDKHNFVAAPFRSKIYAIAISESLRLAFGENLKGEIKRVPLNDDDLRYEDGVINQLVRRATVLALSAKANCPSDGESLIWTSEKVEDLRLDGVDWKVHQAVLVQIRPLGSELALVLKPTLYVTDQSGAIAPKDTERLVKQRVLGYQHNKEFNGATEAWRRRLVPQRDFHVRFPDHEDGIDLTFSGRPLFARITDERERTVSLSSAQELAARQAGLQLAEPRLKFARKSAAGPAFDTHPVRGLINNRPFDSSLTTAGIASSIRVGIIAPARDATRVHQYLSQLHVAAQPGKDADYLPPFPGFASAYQCPIEIPSVGEQSFVQLDEPDSMTPSSARALAGAITRSIASLSASQRPDVTIIYVPDRWAPLRNYMIDDEEFDLHDFVKAAAIPKGCATQFVEEDTLRNTQQQCRVRWWLSLALYVKSMRTPWTLEGLSEKSAYVGLGFSVKRKTAQNAGAHVVLGCSHLYSPNGIGLQFRLSKIEDPIMRNKNPFMSFDDARRLGEGIRELFFAAHLRLPERVVIHKQTPFLREERSGLQAGLEGVACVELLQIFVDDTLRYVASHPTSDGKFEIDNYPIRRGTTVVIDDHTALLWVHGASTALNPGRHYFQGKRRIPAPLVIRRHAGTTDLMTIADEVLGLSKMNFNSFDLYGQLPATIETSRRVARIGALLDRFSDHSYDYRLFM
ncbi:hypothetical protein R54767_01455 [Paraburkholderia gardini]|uniref:SIR2-like protein n=2 Tax=Paraburkholderia gardini TaxID=2823469 RepID=A0ABM8U0Z2_9BURK|nr:hypothetical protein R54767_01455 [Paraburkholderia gardini]